MRSASRPSAAALVFVSPRADFTFPLEDTLAAITPRTRLVFITSPNNPTGVRVSNDDIRAVARALPAGGARLRRRGVPRLLRRHGRARAGQPAQRRRRAGRSRRRRAWRRCEPGAIVAVPETLDAFKPVIPPYSLNVAAAAALRAALADRDVSRLVRRPGARLARALLCVLPQARLSSTGRAARTSCWRASATRATALTEALRAKGIYIRDKSADPNCRGCIRVTTGTVEATEAAVAAMEEYLCAAQ